MTGSLRQIRWANWRPKLFECLTGYGLHDFLHDLLAGLTVGCVALPLAMAFGIASGVTPQAGIYTAVIGGFCVSALGGSRIQIGGPMGAFVVIVGGIIARYGLSGLLMVTMMAGGILLILGFTGLGKAVKFIPRPIVIGFTNGIAVLIASTQIKDFFHLAMRTNTTEFTARIKAIFEALPTWSWPSALLGAVSLGVILLTPRVTKRVPGSIVVLVLATACVALFGIPVETIGTQFGGIPRGLPSLHIPHSSVWTCLCRCCPRR